ncbi:MAG: hypothetical protein A2293_06000 [Elusimicrobia bacterium RIFOXYB2_FULL_49_7]|nr:MAG: hypothetical protein A2293_06000 [Elusimicrobia bacterium RIFOXYB2_FULL_49_7]
MVRQLNSRLLCWVLGTVSLLFAGYDFQAGLDRNQITLGEDITITVQFSGENLKEEPAYPEFSSSADFTLSNKNRQKSSSQNVSIINGRMTRTSVETYTFQFTFKPLKAGDLKLPGCRFGYNDFVRQIGETSVSVLKEGPENHNLSFDLSFSKRDLYLNEQVVLVAAIRVKQNASIRNIGSPDVDKELKKFFWIKPLQDKFEQRNETIGGEAYSVYSMRFIVFPTLSGEVKVPSIPLEYIVMEQRARRRNSPFDDAFFGGAFDNFFDQGNTRKKTRYSNPVTLRVRDLPEAGKPAGFTGAVGSFKMTASLDKEEVKAGEAFNLKVVVNGSGNEKSINSVDIRNLHLFEAFDPEISADVQIKSGVLSVTKTFRYVLIPKSEGKCDVGPVTLYFFNTAKGRYDSLSTTLTLNVKEGKAVRPGTENKVYSSIGGEEIKLLSSDIRYIKTDASRLAEGSRPRYDSPVYWVGVALPPMLLLLSFLFRRYQWRMASDTGYARLKRARKKALKRLKEAEQNLTAPPDRFYAALYKALIEYVADKLNLSAAGMTVTLFESALRDKGAVEETVQELVRLLESCDLHRFSSLPVETSDRKADLTRAETALSHLEEKLS